MSKHDLDRLGSKHADADVSAHRQLSPDEEDALEAGKSRWLPRIFQSYGTPIPELMASPLKTGLIFGVPAGLLGAGIGSAIGGSAHGSDGKGYSGMGALIGGLGAGGLAAIAASMDREAKNEGLEELMRRMPEGAAKRDLLADPQYQSDFLGWDNNKIVATARARYYRPSERFSKRTSDMADARARYNERNKTSSMNKDVSMSENKKHAFSKSSAPLINFNSPQAKAMLAQLHALGLSSALGSIIGGAGGAITSKNKLKGFARGALMGAGTGLGVAGGGRAGFGTGLGAGRLLAGPAGAAYGGLLGLGGGATLGGVGGYGGGKALADTLVGPAEDEDGNIPEKNKQAAQALLNNKDLTLAEKMAQYRALVEKQALGVAPPQKPTSSQPGTGKVLDHLFGVGEGAGKSTLYAESAKRLGQLDATRRSVGESLGKNVLYPAAQGIYAAAEGDRNAINSAIGSVQNAGSRAYKGVFGDKPVLHAAGRGIYNAARSPLTALQGLNSARKNVGGWLGENVLYPVAKGVYNAPGAVADMFKKEPPPPPPGLLEQIMKSKYTPYALGGAAALGLGGLGYSMMNKGKKKKQRREDDEEEDGDMAYDKAAKVNWYKVARDLQKRAMIPTPYALPMAPAAIKATIEGAQQASKFPWRRALAGLGLAGGAGAGVGGLGSLLARKDPSMLQQVMQSKYTPYAAAGLGAAGLLGGAAYMGSSAGKNEAKKKKKKPNNSSDDKQANLADAGLGAGAGALAGGGLGALYGALNPGQEQDPESGRRRRRSRLMAALRGLAAGGVAGGLGGAALGGFAPGVLNSARDRVGLGKELQLPAAPSAAESMATNVAQATPAQRKLHEALMHRKMKAPSTPDALEYARAEATVNNMGEEPGMNDLTGGMNPAMAAQMGQQ